MADESLYFEGPDAFDRLEHTLPQGLHDAMLYRFSVDLEQKELVLQMAADVSRGGEARLQLRPCTVRVSGLAFFGVEYGLQIEGGIGAEFQVDSGVADAQQRARVRLEPTPPRCFAHYIMAHWLSGGTLVFAGRGVRLEWSA